MSVVALVNRLASYTVLHNMTKGRTECEDPTFKKGERRGSKQEVCVLGRPMCHRFTFKLQQACTSEGDSYFIYEYTAWSFLIFNKKDGLHICSCFL